MESSGIERAYDKLPLTEIFQTQLSIKRNQDGSNLITLLYLY
jgi:hypothetical protein